MKKYLLFFIILILLTLLPKRVYALVEEKDIPKLTIDRTKEVPEYELVPRPTPAPAADELKTADKRSWAKSEYKLIIARVAKKYDLDPQVIYAVIMTETHGDKYAFRFEPGISDASFGLGQILLSTARSLGFNGQPKELYKPEISIDLVGKYQRYLLDTYGNLTPNQIATAYNSGSPWKRAAWGHLYRFNLWLKGEDGKLAYNPYAS